MNALIPAGSWEIGTRRPYRLCLLTPPGHTERDRFIISYGEPTGGNGWPADVSYEELDRRAKLIEAAPNLLHLSIALLRFAESVRPGGGVLSGETQVFKTARDVIARASGRST